MNEKSRIAGLKCSTVKCGNQKRGENNLYVINGRVKIIQQLFYYLS
jgi:hypothetical protein